tara:strand:- start:171 stop:542 length:372 start_codon:yes stop_codon:yes gene_type:complete
MIITTMIISKGGYYQVWTCAKIEATLPNPSMLLSKYPACAAYANGTDANEVAVVKANLTGDTGVNSGAGLGVSFGMALWLALAIHALGVEVYVRLPVINYLSDVRLTRNSYISHPERLNVYGR